MKERIQELYNSVFKEIPAKNADYYLIDRYEIQDDEALDAQFDGRDYYVLSDDDQSYFSDTIVKIFDELKNLALRGNYKEAFDGYKLIINKNEKLMAKTIYFIELLDPFSHDSRMGIVKLVEPSVDEKFILSVLQWIKMEILKKEYAHNFHLTALSDLFIDLCSCSPLFLSHAVKFISEAAEKIELPYEYLKLGYYFHTGNYEHADRLITANSPEFNLRKYYIDLYIRNGQADNAIKYAIEYLEQVKLVSKHISTFSLEERQKQYPGREYRNIYAFQSWCGKFILETLIAQKYYDRACDYVYDVFLNNYRVLSMDYYGFIQSKLPEEKKRELSARIFRKADLLPLYTLRDLCEYEDFWAPLIDSFKASKKLSDVLKIYNVNKENLRIFPEEMTEALCTAILNYVETGFDSKKKETIKEGLNELVLFKEGKPFMLTLIYKIKKNYSKRKVLLDTLDEFINANSLGKEYEEYARQQQENQVVNEVRLIEKYQSEKQNHTKQALGKQKSLFWNDNEWVVNKITELRSLKSIFELKKSLPSDASLFNDEQRKQLMNIYHESILYYAAGSKKDEITKARNIIEALENVKNIFGDKSFIRQMISELKSRYPKRIKFIEMLDKEFIAK